MPKSGRRNNGRLMHVINDMMAFGNGTDVAEGASNSTTPPPAPPNLTGVDLFKSLLGQFVGLKDIGSGKVLQFGKLCDGTLTGLRERDKGRAEQLLEDLSEHKKAENKSMADTVRKKLRSLGGETRRWNAERSEDSYCKRDGIALF